MKALLEIQIGEKVTLRGIDGALRAKLLQYGLHIGDQLQVLRVAPLGGPLLIEVNGREIALGRTIAEKILVESE